MDISPLTNPTLKTLDCARLQPKLCCWDNDYILEPLLCCSGVSPCLCLCIPQDYRL